MSDPLLTSLCSICHINPPKYRCPRCSKRTCSVACVKKHRAWSSCNGERDATEYLPRSRLRTPAGVDHDYNFLHKIELGVERAERISEGDRGVFAEGELSAKRAEGRLVREVQWKTGKDGRKRKVVVMREAKRRRGGGGGAGGGRDAPPGRRMLEKLLAQRLRKMNTLMEFAPTGMSRQRENATTFNRRSGRLHWQVEWLAVPREGQTLQPERLLAKAFDDMPLSTAYRGALEGPKTTNGRPYKGAGGSWSGPGQSTKATWHDGQDMLQKPNGTWSPYSRANDPTATPQDAAAREEHQFYLARPHQRNGEPTIVTAVKSDACLRNILADTRVLEFPTIYTLPAGHSLPKAFRLGPKDPAPERQKQKQEQGQKRKGGPAGEQQLAKRTRGGEVVEAGVDVEDGEADAVAALEDGETGKVGGVVAVGESMDEDDITSSSGSDSSSEEDESEAEDGEASE